MTPLVVDASVFVAAAQVDEPDHTSSIQFLAQVRESSSTTVACPVLVLAESGGAISRVTGDPAEGVRIIAAIERYPGIKLVGLTLPLGRRAASLATVQKLRGADSIYVAVARRLDATLITLDREILDRARAVVRVLTPTEWLQQRSQAP